MHRVLVVRLDGAGDVLLAGPAVRAVAAAPDTEVTLLCGPAGAEAGHLLPGVSRVLSLGEPVGGEPRPTDQPRSTRPHGRHARRARVRRGRRPHLVPPVAAADRPPAAARRHRQGHGRVGRLPRHAARRPPAARATDPRTTCPRTCPNPSGPWRSPQPPGTGCPPPTPGGSPCGSRHLWTTCSRHCRACHTSCCTPERPSRHGDGPPHATEAPPASLPATASRWSSPGAGTSARSPQSVAGVARSGAAPVLDLGGRTGLPELSGVLAQADAVVVGNTGAAHLAAAVGTPVVSLFAPVVPAVRWRPYGVRHVLLGDQAAACRDTRARDCPVPGHPCLARVQPDDVLASIRRLRRAVDAGQPGRTARRRRSPCR